MKRISHRIRNDVGNQLNLRSTKSASAVKNTNNKTSILTIKDKKPIRKIQRFNNKDVTNLKYKPSTNQITPFSWRAGQEAIRVAFKEMKASQITKKPSLPQQDYSTTSFTSSSSSSTSSASSYSAIRASTPTPSKETNAIKLENNLDTDKENQDSSSKEKEDLMLSESNGATSPTESDDSDAGYRGIASEILRELKG